MSVLRLSILPMVMTVAAFCLLSSQISAYNVVNNECQRKEDNECSENARCIDLEFLYRCECNKGFLDTSAKHSIPGSRCVPDHCNNVTFCPGDSNCVQEQQLPECRCHEGFLDIYLSVPHMSLHYCVAVRDADECALRLHNCSSHAICTDLPYGYECQCPDGWVDGGQPELPGRICARKLCAQCHEHGACVPNSVQNGTDVICECFEGYTGQFCEVAPSGSRFVPCSDDSFCPGNSTCVQKPDDQAECHCPEGFLNISRSTSRIVGSECSEIQPDKICRSIQSLGLGPDQQCLAVKDVDECALGLHNCFEHAICIDLTDGFVCHES